MELILYSINILFGLPIHFDNVKINFVKNTPYLNAHSLLYFQSDFKIANNFGPLDIVVINSKLLFYFIYPQNFWEQGETDSFAQVIGLYVFVLKSIFV